MPVSSADIALAERLADAAGAAIRPRFRGSFGLEAKDDLSPVTLADREAEEAMRRLIIAERPMDGIIGEEFGTREGSSGRQWVLDPIDGTRAFIAGLPTWGVLIALATATELSALLWLSGAAGFALLGANYALYGVAPAYYPNDVRGTGSGASVAVGRVGSIIGPASAGLLAAT